MRFFFLVQDMFVDATIACGGKVYSAHKFVLSTCSDYFKHIFTRNPNSNPIVFMKDVSCRDIEALLDFMYHGEVNVPQSSLGSLIKTAEGLQIKGLAVPDDPPSSRREQDRDKREREPSSSSYLENRSPPPKRRVREKNSPPRRSSHIQSSSQIPHRPPPVVPTDNSADNSVTDRVKCSSPSITPDKQPINSSNAAASKPCGTNSNVNNDTSRHSLDEDEDRGDSASADDNSAPATLDNQAPGPSGLIHSKQEEVVSFHTTQNFTFVDTCWNT